MDVDTRLRMSQFRDDSGNHGHLQFVQLMGHTIVRHRVHARIAEDHLAEVGGCGVVVKHRLHISIEQPLDLWQRVDKGQCQPFGLSIYLFLRADGFTVFTELQSVGYLLRQQRGQFLHVHTDIIRADALIGLSLVEIVWEHDVLHQHHDALHLLY